MERHLYTRSLNICIQRDHWVVSSIFVNYIQQSRVLYWHYHSIGHYMESIESISIMSPTCGDAVLPGQLLWNSWTFSILKTSSFFIKHNRFAFFHTGATRVITFNRITNITDHMQWNVNSLFTRKRSFADQPNVWNRL